MKKHFFSIAIFFRILVPGITHAQGTEAIQLFVSVSGNANNSGTLLSPFSSPDQALNALNKMTGSIHAVVYIRGGYYSFSKGLVLSTSGIDTTRHITFENYHNEKVIFSGGVKLNNKEFYKVSDANILNKLPALARNKVYAINLKADGISDFGQDHTHGYKTHNPSNLELFYNGTPLTVARWPNTGLAPIGTVVDPGSNPRNGDKDNRGATFTFSDPRMNRWTDATNAWVGGIFSYGYSDDYLRVASFDPANREIHLKDAAGYSVFSSNDISTGPLKNAQPLRGFYVYNVLEEIDTAGEWYMDRNTGILYVWPPDNGINIADINVSLLEDPIITIKNINNITLDGISIAYGRGMGVLVENTRNTTISNCIIDDLGTVGLTSENQTSNLIQYYYPTSSTGNPNAPYNIHLLIQSCKIYNTGGGGVVIDGGDRKNLIPADNVINNSEIYNYSRLDVTYGPAVYISGVNNHINHCFIHDAPDAAIIFFGNDEDISYNHLKNVITNLSDFGAVYTGRDLTATGNHIEYNFFESIGSNTVSTCAVYLDDGNSGIQVDNNVFYNCGSRGANNFGAIYINGGSDNYFRNNYFIDCTKAFSNYQWSDAQWKSYITNPTNTNNLYKIVDIRTDLYAKKYSHLSRLTDSVNIAPRKNYSFNSLAFNVPVFSTGSSYVHTNIFATLQDPGFENISTKNFKLLKYPPALQQTGDWKPIPFDAIGLLR